MTDDNEKPGYKKPKRIYKFFACGVNNIIENDSGKCQKDKLNSTRQKLKKLWRNKLFYADDEEVKNLVEDDTIKDSESLIIKIDEETNLSQNKNKSKKKSKKRFMKKMGKFVLQTCRYMGMGVELVSPGIVSTHAMSMRYTYPGYSYDHSYIYNEFTGNDYSPYNHTNYYLYY